MSKIQSMALSLIIVLSGIFQASAQKTNAENKTKSKMTNLNYDFTINAPADSVWAIVGDLGACSKWIPGIISVAMDNKNRTCTTADGHEIKEVITEHSNEKRIFSYTQTQVPLPIKDSRGTFQVLGNGKNTQIIWRVEFQLLDPSTEKEMVPMIDGYYQQTLENLRQVVEN